MRKTRRHPHTEFTGMEDVLSILKRSFKNLKLDGSLCEHTIIKVWDDVVGKNIARRAQPYRVIGSTFYVRVASTPWMQELNFMKESIRVKLNERLEEKKIKEIILKLGRCDKRTIKRKAPNPPWMDVNLSKKDETSLKQEVAFVKDPELRNILLKVFVSEKKLRKFKSSLSIQQKLTTRLTQLEAIE